MLNETYLGSNFKKSDYGVLDRFDPYSRHSRFAFRLDNAIMKDFFKEHPMLLFMSIMGLVALAIFLWVFPMTL